MQTATPKVLPIPDHFDAKNASDWNYGEDEMQILGNATNWATRYNIPSSANDKFKVHLLMIDLQKDFCFPQGNLFVAGRSGTGAIDDNVRISEFIYQNLMYLTEITATLDSHLPFQIFFTPFWMDEDGKHPEAHTIITTDDIRKGKYSPNPAVASWLCGGNYNWLMQQVEFYCDELEKAKKYTLYLWPPHCLLGGKGHPLVSVIQEARLFHAYARGAKNSIQVKGANFLTENYSVFSPEVLMRFDGSPLAQRNTNFLDDIVVADATVILGQAGSHCVASSIGDLLAQLMVKDHSLCKKVYIVRNCMSPVTVPDGKGGFVFDFTDNQDKALDEFIAAGMNVVESTTPMEDWPGMNL